MIQLHQCFIIAIHIQNFKFENVFLIYKTINTKRHGYDIYFNRLLVGIINVYFIYSRRHDSIKITLLNFLFLGILTRET